MDFWDGVILIHLVIFESQYAVVGLGIREGSLYKLAGEVVVGFRGSLELSSRWIMGFGSVLVTQREREALLTNPTWYEMTLMEEEHMYHDKSPTQVLGESSNSKGATTTVERISDQ